MNNYRIDAKVKKLKDVRSVFQIKTHLGLEVLMYYLFSIFVTYLIAIVLEGRGLPFSTSFGVSVTSGLIVLLGIWRFNNYVFVKDKLVLTNLIVTQRIDSFDIFHSFFLDIDNRFKAFGVSFTGLASHDQLSLFGIDRLFKNIFSEDGIHLFEKLIKQHGNLFCFLQSLNDVEREKLLRYYIVK